MISLVISHSGYHVVDSTELKWKRCRLVKETDCTLFQFVECTDQIHVLVLKVQFGSSASWCIAQRTLLRQHDGFDRGLSIHGTDRPATPSKHSRRVFIAVDSTAGFLIGVCMISREKYRFPVKTSSQWEGSQNAAVSNRENPSPSKPKSSYLKSLLLKSGRLDSIGHAVKTFSVRPTANHSRTTF